MKFKDQCLTQELCLSTSTTNMSFCSEFEQKTEKQIFEKNMKGITYESGEIQWNKNEQRFCKKTTVKNKLKENNEV